MGNAAINYKTEESATLKRSVKLIVVGDNSNGLKTKFLFAYTLDGKEMEYIPSVRLFLNFHNQI